MSLDLILKDMKDPLVRENFFRIQRFVAMQAMLLANFKFMEFSVPAAGTSIPVRHGLGFIPKDIIVTSVLGDLTYYFDSHKFDRENLYINTSGPITLRVFVGTYQAPINPNVRSDLQMVPPGFVIDGGNADGD